MTLTCRLDVPLRLGTVKSAALGAVLGILLVGCGPITAPAGRGKAPVTRMTVRRAHPLVAALSGTAAAFAQNVIWLVGGLNAADVSASTLWAYDPKRGVVRTSHLPFRTHDAAAVAQGSHLLLVGGGRFTSLDTFGRVALPSGAFTTLGTTPAPLSDLWAGMFGGLPTVVGGFTGERASAKVWQFRDGAWKSLAVLPYGVRYPAVAAGGGRLYVAGGLTGVSDGPGEETPRILAVGRTGKVTALGKLPKALYRAGAAWEDGALYIFGGKSGSGYLDTIYRFDPGTGKTRRVGRLPAAWAYGGVIREGRQVYLLGGMNAGGTLASVWRVEFSVGR